MNEEESPFHTPESLEALRREERPRPDDIGAVALTTALEIHTYALPNRDGKRWSKKMVKQIGVHIETDLYRPTGDIIGLIELLRYIPADSPLVRDIDFDDPDCLLPWMDACHELKTGRPKDPDDPWYNLLKAISDMKRYHSAVLRDREVQTIEEPDHYYLGVQDND